jgi:DNA polymerase III delta subunit
MFPKKSKNNQKTLKIFKKYLLKHHILPGTVIMLKSQQFSKAYTFG